MDVHQSFLLRSSLETPHVTIIIQDKDTNPKFYLVILREPENVLNFIYHYCLEVCHHVLLIKFTLIALTVSQTILNSTCWPAMKISVKRETATYAPTLKLSCLSGRKMGQDGERRKTYSAAVTDGCERTSTISVGDSIVRKTDRRLGKGKDVVVCLPGARIEHVTERVEKIVGRGKGGTILVHVGTNNANKEGTTAIVKKYRDLLKRTKYARVGQIILSGILPVIGGRNQGYRNSRRMSINRLVQQLCKEEDVGFVDLWSSFVAKEEM